MGQQKAFGHFRIRGRAACKAASWLLPAMLATHAYATECAAPALTSLGYSKYQDPTCVDAPNKTTQDHVACWRAITAEAARASLSLKTAIAARARFVANCLVEHTDPVEHAQEKSSAALEKIVVAQGKAVLLGKNPASIEAAVKRDLDVAKVLYDIHKTAFATLDRNFAAMMNDAGDPHADSHVMNLGGHWAVIANPPPWTVLQQRQAQIDSALAEQAEAQAAERHRQAAIQARQRRADEEAAMLDSIRQQYDQDTALNSIRPFAAAMGIMIPAGSGSGSGSGSTTGSINHCKPNFSGGPGVCQ